MSVWKRREFPCFDAVESAVDCIAREAVLLQNIAEYGDFDDRLRHLRGLAAAAHRGWRELNERLARTFITSVEREDVSALVRELAELSDALAHVAVVWRAGSLERGVAERWTALLADGSRHLRDLVAQLPLLRTENRLAACAEELYTLRRESDTRFDADTRRLRGAALATVTQFHACVVAMARIADTAEWLTLKNA